MTRSSARSIRARRAAARTLDLGAPVALMLLIILHLIPDVDAPGEIVAELDKHVVGQRNAKLNRRRVAPRLPTAGSGSRTSSS